MSGTELGSGEPFDRGEPFWAIVELMGHRRLAGLVFEESRFGTKMLRLDVPAEGGKGFRATQFYGGAALYCVTPCTEEMARSAAVYWAPPVSVLALPGPRKEDLAGVGCEDDGGGDYSERELEP